jgi:hypothetical protein
MKKLLIPMIVLSFVMISFARQKTGDTHAVESLFGAKYTGAPSQALAGRMGLMFEHLEDILHQSFTGIVQDPEPIHKLGYKTVQKGDKIEMKRIAEHTWELKHLKSQKVFQLKVVS